MNNKEMKQIEQLSDIQNLMKDYKIDEHILLNTIRVIKELEKIQGCTEDFYTDLDLINLILEIIRHNMRIQKVEDIQNKLYLTTIKYANTIVDSLSKEVN